MALTTDIRDKDQIRTYNRADSIVFLKTREAFGGLSNMAGGFPLCVNGIDIRTSEALYQACRFPHLPEVQRLIIEQRSPMTAKMKSRKHHQDSRQDWDWIRVKIMRWCLRVKLIQNWHTFSELLLETGDQSIVEQSRKDDFWGAKPIDKHTLVGVNALGRLLMGLREEVKNEGQEAFLQVEPLDILNFSLDGRPIEPVTAPDRRAVAINAETSESPSYVVQPLLFDPSVVKEPSPPEYAAETSKNTGIANFEPYPAYKDSGIDWLGKIPAHWIQLPGRTCYSEKKISNTGMQENTVLSLSYGQLVIKPPEKLHGLVPESFETYQIVAPSDIIVRPTDLQNDWNSLRFGLSRYRGIITSAYMCLYTEDTVTPEYGYLLLHTYDLKKVFYGLGSGLRQNLSWVDFKYLPCLVPPLSEQAAIVEYFDQATADIDEAIDKNQRLIELLKELKQTTIAEAVTKGLNPNVPMRDSGVEWLGEVPAHWDISHLRWFIAIKSGEGISDSQFSKETLDEDSYPVIGGNGTMGYSKHFNTTQKAFAIGRVGALCGNVHFLKEKCWITDNALKVSKWEGFNDSYFEYMLGTANLNQYANQSAQPLITGEQVKALPVPRLPLEDQKKIAVFLDQKTADIDEAIEKKQHLIELLKELKQITIAEAVTGKIKV